MRIIPAIDIIEGKCVRLTQGDYNQKKIYNENPLEVAKQFEAEGLQYLHLVDLDGAKEKKVINWKVLERIVSKTSLKVDFGGGLHSKKDIQMVFECGANQVTAGSIAVKNKELYLNWISQYGAEKIILGADVKEEKIAVSGWQETTKIDIYDFIKENVGFGIKYIVCTDIAKDGVLSGPSLELYKEILKRNNKINLIASGGVTTIDDIKKLKEIGLEGVIIGKAIYEGKIQLKQLEELRV